ncbi:hypothetical protein GCM10011309_14930 [Litorimonas cladophorae]|uniref:Uncharacterized protein n=1 Tax=Litorimonas cladophorae TaxID=1220491 RepID=A0A918KJ14_9PROT|nr:hypothetical protein [Litorimonas cladophorae]GGX65684.1 hypothetical protein GCM10011309_14930 [Litorimonas cladophorae]
MALISSVFTSAIIIATVSAFPAFFGRKSKLAKVKFQESGEKYIELSKFLFWLIYGVGASFTILGVFVYLFSEEPIAGVGFTIMGLVFLVLTAFLQFIDTSVSWTSEIISGAKSGVSIKKNSIFWNDIVMAKYHANHTIQLKDKLGKSVFWTVYHNGWHEIIDDLRLIRPDIDTSDFD